MKSLRRTSQVRSAIKKYSWERWTKTAGAGASETSSAEAPPSAFGAALDAVAADPRKAPRSPSGKRPCRFNKNQPLTSGRKLVSMVKFTLDLAAWTAVEWSMAGCQN